MEQNSFWQRRIWNIRLSEWAALLGFYSVFAYAYHSAIALSSGGGEMNVLHSVLDYSLKAVLTAPIWYLIFRVLTHWKIWQKVILNAVVFMPLWVVGWQQLYYYICEQLGYGHLRWPGSWWDIYIPGLFYVLQFGIFHFYDHYQKLQEERETAAALRQAALQSELTALKSQLNPHFLYNTFNTISASVPAEQESTRIMIAKLSDLFRYQLRVSKREVVPLHEEIEFIRTYLELEKERFQERLSYEIDIDPSVEERVVPPMLLQPLVENAIRHGLAPKIEGGTIRLQAKAVAGGTYFKVVDDGVGMNAATINRGIGLGNTELRLEKRYQEELSIQPATDGGVAIEFTIPQVAS